MVIASSKEVISHTPNKDSFDRGGEREVNVRLQQDLRNGWEVKEGDMVSVAYPFKKSR